jgi:hypothetical protein
MEHDGIGNMLFLKGIGNMLFLNMVFVCQNRFMKKKNCLGTTEKHRYSENNALEQIIIEEQNNHELTMTNKGI